MSELAGGHLTARAAKIAAVVVKHGVRDRLERGEGRAARLRAVFEELGPTFGKLGQILSTRPDLLPPEVVDELSTLQDRVPPLTEAEVVGVMEEELGVPWEDVFESIEPQPLAAGTMGQVHVATLGDGERVVVKVQRPGAREEIMRDLGLLELFAERAAARDELRALIDIPALVEHLSSSLRRELDCRIEAANAERMRTILDSYTRIDVPRVYGQLTTQRLLVLEYIDGVSLREAPLGEERREAAKQLLDAYYRQILGEGFFHADPHPGNLRWSDGKIFLLDLGMVGEVDPVARELMQLMLLAFWRGDASFLGDLVLLLGGGTASPELNLDDLRADFTSFIERYRVGSLSDIRLGPMLEEMVQIAARHGIRLPASLALTGKAFGQMQLAVTELDPELDPFKVVQDFVVGDLRGRVRSKLDPQSFFYEMQKARMRVTRFVEALERATGARPGAPLQVQLRHGERLEEAIRRAGRRVSLAVASGAGAVAAGVTAAGDVKTWIPIVFGCAAGAAALGLARDLWRR
jgi:predicted unusual protein kinase regulating ubiquinone biosynthesis (AarF/ABC1/UbiB family)